jgi:hypothetical protein
MGGPGPAQFFFVKRKIKKYFWNFTIFPRIFMSLLLISSNIFFMSLKMQNLILKYPVFIKTSKIQKKFEKKKKMFYAYGQVSQS